MKIASLKHLEKMCSEDTVHLNEELLGDKNTSRHRTPDRVVIILPGERPPSANSIYAGTHWSRRHVDAGKKHDLVARHVPAWLGTYKVPVRLTFNAYFKRTPMDSSNVFYAAKMYEDGLVLAGVLKDDTIQYVKSVTVSSNKSDRNYVEIIIEKG